MPNASAYPILNLYCDESCHLEQDVCPVMVLGAIACPEDQTRAIATDLRAIKDRHHLHARSHAGHTDAFEIKWTKVSPAKQAFYLEVINYFLDSPHLSFRALVIPDKRLLRHEDFAQDHDTFYYKMQFRLIEVLLRPNTRHHIYLDIKDTRSSVKMAKLHDVLCSATYDGTRDIIARVQTVRSHEVEQLQLADLLIGAVSYANRQLTGNAGKLAIIERLRQRTGLTLTHSTLIRENKFNVFVWSGR
jgi:hypothetical protein